MDFIIDTLFHIFFAFFWIIGLIIFLVKEKNKKRYVFLIFCIPLLIWTVFSYNHVLKPRFQDVTHYINKDYETIIGKCIVVYRNTKGTTPSFKLENKDYYYNPKFNKIDKDKTYKLMYLPNSKYVIESELLD